MHRNNVYDSLPTALFGEGRNLATFILDMDFIDD